jgi:hypothetical protein
MRSIVTAMAEITLPLASRVQPRRATKRVTNARSRRRRDHSPRLPTDGADRETRPALMTATCGTIAMRVVANRSFVPAM